MIETDCRMYTMQGRCVAFLITIIILSTTGHEITVWNECNCPSNYSVFTSEGKRIGIEIRSTSNSECNNLVGNSRNCKELIDLKPTIHAAFKNGRYVANITWVYEGKAKKLPKQFLLNMTFYEKYVGEGNDVGHRYSNHTCIRLVRGAVKEKGRKVIKVKFYFDCLSLQNPELIGLSAAVGIFRRCTGRSIRSLPDGSQRCGTPGIHCSPPYPFAVTREAHKYRQCACYKQYYGYPNLTWHRDIKSQEFRITVSNLPPFLVHHVELEVFSADKNDLYMFTEQLMEQRDDEKSLEFRVNLSDGNNFEVYVRVNATLATKCEEPGPYERAYKNEINNECNTDGTMFVAYHKQFDEVVSTPKDESPKKGANTRDIQYTIAILTAVILTAAITAVVFICYRRKTCCPSPSVPPEASGLELVQLRPMPTHGELHLAEHAETELDNQQKGTEKDQVSLNQDTNEECYKALINEKHNAEDDMVQTNYHQNQPPSLKKQLQISACTSKVNCVPVLCVQCKSNSNYNDKVTQLTCFLRQNHSLELDIVWIQPNCVTNHDKCLCYSDHAILIMSEDLNEICRKSADVLRTVEGYGVHSCDVLKTLKKYAPNMNQTSIHLVSFCTGEHSTDVIMQFQQDHDLGKRSNCYYFVGDRVDSSINQYVLNQLTKRIFSGRALGLCKQTTEENRPSGLGKTDDTDINVSDKTSSRTKGLREVKNTGNSDSYNAT